jgi:hypothetical protein
LIAAGGVIVAALVIVVVLQSTRARTVTPPQILPTSTGSDPSSLIPEGVPSLRGASGGPAGR